MKIPPVLVVSTMKNIREMFENYFADDIVNTITHEEQFYIVTFIERETNECIETFIKNIGGQFKIDYKNNKYLITSQYLDI